MKSFFDGLFGTLFLIVVAIGAWKYAQKYCWNHNLAHFAPPSVTSWDPLERVEAARRVGQKYGGRP